MGRRRQSYKLAKRGSGIWYVVGTTPDGRRVHRSTRTRSRKTAAQRLPLIVEREEAGVRATVAEVANTPLEELLAAWLTSAATEVASAQGNGSLFETYARHFLRFFRTTERICDEVAIEQYKEQRLGQVQATTLRGELSALRRLHRWMKKRKLLSALPEVPKVPKRATGTAHKLGRRQVVKLSPDEMDEIIAHLPALTRKGYPVRDFVTFVRETSLRPSTVFGLQAPHDYEPGARLLRIRDENDKARFGRDVPITDRARKAIDSRFPCDGTIFPEFDCRDLLRGAARAAGISAHRASKLSIYDFRHGRGTEWGRTGNLIGIAYLMGHKHVTTTKEYLHSNIEEARSVLFRTTFFT
ncbi:MAG: tyrosine-type recombinase/integrase, partial [Polyangiales bacterium]